MFYDFLSFMGFLLFFFVKQKTAYEMRISDWSSDVCSSDLISTRPVCLRHISWSGPCTDEEVVLNPAMSITPCLSGFFHHSRCIAIWQMLSVVSFHSNTSSMPQ